MMDNENEIDGVDKNESLAEEISANIRASIDHLSTWTSDAREAYDFYASRQWTSSQLEANKSALRNSTVYNRIPRTVNLITGLEVQNRQEITYYPRNVENQGSSDVMNSAGEWAADNCDAEDEESEAFEDMLICGLGATMSKMDYESDSEGRYVEERRDPLTCGYDPRAKKRNLVDRRYCWTRESYSKREFFELWPDAGLLPNGERNEASFVERHYDYEVDQSDDSTTRKNAPYDVYHYQYYELEDYCRLITPQGEIEIDMDQYAQAEAAGLLTPDNHVKMKRKRFKQVFICGKVIINANEDGSIPDCPVNRFTICFITGFRDRNKNTWFGPVALMIDPQRTANKYLSQMQYYMSTNSGGGGYYESGTFADEQDALAKIARPDAMIEVVPGALRDSRLQQKQSNPLPQGYTELLKLAIDAVTDVLGISQELLGMSGTVQAGYLEAQRKQAGVTILAKLFDSLRRHRKEKGDVRMTFIQEYISDGRLIRISGKGNEQYVPLAKDKLAREYDIIVAEAPTSPNQKEKVFGILQQLLPTLLQAGVPIPPDLLEYAPFPAKLTTAWMKFIEDSKAPNPENQAMDQLKKKMAMLAVQEKEADIAVKKSQAFLNVSKAGEGNEDADKDGIPDIVELRKAEIQNETQKIRTQGEVIKSQADLQKEKIKLYSNIKRNQPTGQTYAG